MGALCSHCGSLHAGYVTSCPITGARLGSVPDAIVSEDEALVGAVVADRYQVRGLLGQGSTGTVFDAVHAQLERAVAIKVLRPRFTTTDAVQRALHSDVGGALRIWHPSLCEVYDVGALPDGAPYFVMERLEGETLATRLGRERFSTSAGVDLAMQLLSAVDAVHAQGLLLRDMRPQNLFLAQRRGCRPVLKILDFGLSRLIAIDKLQPRWDSLRSLARDTDTSGLLAIPYYLSPERARGEQNLEPSSDIFVAGAILYEALTGHKPFQASSWSALVAQISEGKPAPIAALRPDVPDPLGAILMRALSADPASRPPSAREMQDEVRAAFQGPQRASSSMRLPVASAIELALDRQVRAPRERTDRPPPVVITHSPRTRSQPAPGQPGVSLPADEVFEEETNPQQFAAAPAERGADVDEASAEHPIRTVRPPSSVDIELDSEDMTTLRHGSARAALGVPVRRDSQDEETATMELSPELRARIKQMTRTQQMPSTPDEPPPPADPTGRPRRS